jgi:hypothetical protein
VNDLEAELRALCTRAADAEARRQAARDRGDHHAEATLEEELRRLWRRHAEVEMSGSSTKGTQT